MSTQPILTILAGVPIDCSGRFTGVERMPRALRAAGLGDRLNIKDAGDFPITIDSAARDPITGIIGFQQVCQVSDIIRLEVGKLLRRGERPLLIGGCCTLLIGVAAALRQAYGPVGLAFVDGHLDFYDGTSSPTGEAADMELAILTGYGPTGLVDLGGPPPLIAPGDIVAMGFRDSAQSAANGAPDPAARVPQMRAFDVNALRGTAAAKVGCAAAQQFERSSQKFWLHLDLDVLDENEMPAVDYPMPRGLRWEEVARLIRPLVHSPAIVGADVTIFNPTLDPTGDCAQRIVQFLASNLTA